MPTPTTTGVAPNTRGRGREGDARTPVATVPFIRASAKHREPAGIDVARQLTGSTQDLGVFDIPALGFLRAVTLVVTATGGVGSGVTSAEDGPWNVLQNIALTEPNGSQIVAFNNGYDLYLADKWGGYGYVGGQDFRASPSYSAIAAGSGNFSFMLRVPLELSTRDAVGALPNQNAAATFKLRLGLAAASTVYGTVPTTLPTVRVRAYMEAWEQPANTENGLVNQTVPPAVNTTQFWSTQVFNVNAGAQNIRLTRTGNWIRNIIAVYRRNGTSRANGHLDWPDPLTILLDARTADIVERNNWLHQMFERSGFGGAQGTVIPALDSPQGLDAGVFVYDFTHEFDGSLGMENRDLWQPTLGSTRFEFQGTFANPGTLTVLTNDVAVAGNVFI